VNMSFAKHGKRSEAKLAKGAIEVRIFERVAIASAQF